MTDAIRGKVGMPNEEEAFSIHPFWEAPSLEETTQKSRFFRHQKSDLFYLPPRLKLSKPDFLLEKFLSEKQNKKALAYRARDVKSIR